MKIIGIIPARYASSRFKGKPLADICGYPMIWWVYNQVKKVKKLNEVYVAIDDERVEECCKKYNIKYIMTSNQHKTSTERVYEVAKRIFSDLYLVINGDEPLINPEVIEEIIPEETPKEEIYVSNLMTEIERPSEVIDFTNIKIVTDNNSNALFFSRSPIPYPKSSLDYKYYKHLGVLIYNLNALRFFSNTKKGKNELVEDINELRFIENGKKIKMKEVKGYRMLSVDTPKDLETVIEEIKSIKITK